MTIIHTYPATFERGQANKEALTVPAVLSTETPVKRGDFIEILQHRPGSVDFSRFPLPLIEAHHSDRVNVGIAEHPRIEDGKLRAVVRFGTTQRARELFDDIQSGIVRNISIGYEWLAHSENMQGHETTITVARFKPYEVSIVSIPADHNAGFFRGKTMTIQTTESTQTTDTKGNNDSQDSNIDLNDKQMQRAMEAERGRARDIRNFGLQSRTDEATINSLIERGISTQEAKNIMIDQWAAKVDSETSRCDTSDISFGGYGQRHVHEAIIDGLLIRSGIKLEKPHPAAQDFSSSSIHEISRILLRDRGDHNSSGTPAVLIKRAMSHSDLPYILENVANKSLVMGFELIEQNHDKFVNFVDIQDFKMQSRVALSAFETLTEVQELGEVRFSGLTDNKESYKIATYQRAIAFSRQALINDDLSALTDTPKKLGAAARRTEADLVFSIFNNNPLMADSAPLFEASRENLLTGSSSALDATALAKAVIVLRKARDISGVAYLGVRPRWLLVPPELEIIALQLLATLTNTTASASAIPNSDIARIEVIVEPRLDSQTAWFLLGSNIETIEVGRLSQAGGGGISFEAEKDFMTDAYNMKVRLDAGAKALTPKGMVKSSGA